MYYFLGIVVDEDILRGDMSPSYIVCQSHGTSEKRSGWRVIRQDKTNKVLRNMNKVLVKSLIGNDLLIEYMCNYRTRDHMHGDKKYKHEDTKKYFPKGALFWFECNQYGEPNGTAIFIKKVPVNPDVSFFELDIGFRKLKEAKKTKPKLKEILSKEPTYEINDYSNIKPRLVQQRRRNNEKLVC